MLKLKDNIDLKELKKCGLHPVYQCNSSTGETRIIGFDTNGFTFKHLFFKRKKKRVIRTVYNDSFILIFNEEKEVIDLNLLYDLIKADLVEKW